MQMGQISKILLEEQQESLLQLEKPTREEVDAKELGEIVVKDESTSSEPEEIKKISLEDYSGDYSLERCTYKVGK